MICLIYLYFRQNDLQIPLFDLFENESLGNNKKSMAFSLEYFDESRTLKEEEVEKDFVNLISLVTKNFNATLRGK